MAALNTLTVKLKVAVVSGSRGLNVQVPLLPDVVKVPAVAVGAGVGAKAKVGGRTSRYTTENAARGPLLRAAMVKVPVDPTMVGGAGVL